MTRTVSTILFMILFSLFMTGCAGLEIMPQKNAMIPTGAGYEDCIELKTTDTLKLYFESNVPLNFNIHCHKDGVKTTHNEMNVTRWEGTYTPEWGEYYCLQWQNDSATMADVNYGFKLVPPESP